MAMGKLIRHTLLEQQDDLEESTLRFTEAIYLPLPRDISRRCLNVVQLFYRLTLAFFVRTEESRRPEDVTHCITYLRYLRGPWHEDSIDFITVTATLVRALAIQVELESGVVDQDIEEMAGLCDELLNSDITSNIPIESLTRPIEAFARAVDARQSGTLSFEGKFLSEKNIKCLQKAAIRLPDLHAVSLVAAESFLNRFIITASDEDYQEGMAILDKVTTSHGPGDMLSTNRQNALTLAVAFATARCSMYGKPEHLEHLFYRIRTWLDRAPLENAGRPFFIQYLSHSQRLRSNIFDPNVLASSTSESARLPSFQYLTASLPELNTIKPLSVTTLQKHRDALVRVPYVVECLTDIADIEDGIKYCQQLLASYPDSPLSPHARAALPWLFYRAFEVTIEIEYLNKAISTGRCRSDAVLSPIIHLISLCFLTSSLLTRVRLLNRGEDLDELMQVHAMIAKYKHIHAFRQVPLPCEWASLAHEFGHPSASTAYDYAMSFMQDSLTFAPTLDSQHSLLASMSNMYKTLPLEYASYQIHSSQLKQAIETLERGRVLLWSEMRGFRTPIHQIRLADSHLADKFAAVNNDLETLTLAYLPNNHIEGDFGGLGEMDPYGRLVVRQQKLLDDREKLIEQIQALPGFDTFLKPPSFDILHAAALRGPVIIINHCQWRCDILILLHNSSPSLIPTSDDFYAHANKLQTQLLDARKKGLESSIYDDALHSVLKELYELVGRPVIKRLNELKVPEQSRIWWCPTSVFCSLPLHAMGPIPSDVGPPRYFLDLYIPSYTPSLSALIESRKPGSQTFGKPSMLLVLLPDESMQDAFEEMKAVQAVRTRVKTLIGATATPTAVLERLHDHRFTHIVCHGILEPGEPFESSFKLFNGKRLSLFDIVRSRLPNAEFAFLAACHTAELTNESPADEVLHLTAAMQYCGFRSVVGTMWAMADTDGRNLAENFYKSVFSGGGQGTHYYERTAEALRDAVVKLRRKRGIGMTLERWVNYVHYGA